MDLAIHAGPRRAVDDRQRRVGRERGKLLGTPQRLAGPDAVLLDPSGEAVQFKDAARGDESASPVASLKSDMFGLPDRMSALAEA